jgi:hypothetical protein
MKVSPLVAAALMGLLLPVSGLAQTSTPATPTQKSPDASSPSTHRSTGMAMSPDGMGQRHSVQGEVTEVDADKGWVNVKTSDGRMKVHLPSGLEKLKAGDRVTLEVGVSRGASATR